MCNAEPLPVGLSVVPTPVAKLPSLKETGLLGPEAGKGMGWGGESQNKADFVQVESCVPGRERWKVRYSHIISCFQPSLFIPHVYLQSPQTHFKILTRKWTEGPRQVRQQAHSFLQT